MKQRRPGAGPPDAPGAPRQWTEHTVTPEEAGRTVEEVLTGSMGVSRRMIQRLTRSKGLQLNRRPGFLARKVKAGDVVAARLAPAEEAGLAPVPMELAVVHEDADVLLLDKPPFLLVHPTSPEQDRTLAHGVAHHFAAQGLRAKVRPVHRIDRDTSGLVLFAKSAQVHAHLDRQLRERELGRAYLAFVRGSVAEDEGVVDAPIGRDRKRPDLRAVRPDGEPARTRFRVVERFPGATLLELELETGRTHQIRVHMAHLGHPVLGDRPYGGAGRDAPKRQALHAHRISFAHPRTGERLELRSPLPPDLEALRERLGGGWPGRRSSRRRRQRQSPSATASPTTAESTTSLTKCAPAATRDQLEPAASAYHTHRARGKRCASIPAAPQATSAWLLGRARPPVERGRSDQARNTYSPAWERGRSRRKRSFSTSAAAPPSVADPSSRSPRVHAARHVTVSGRSWSASASAAVAHRGRNPITRSIRPRSVPASPGAARCR